jgi:hypothetical protein
MKMNIQVHNCALSSCLAIKVSNNDSVPLGCVELRRVVCIAFIALYLPTLKHRRLQTPLRPTDDAHFRSVCGRLQPASVCEPIRCPGCVKSGITPCIYIAAAVVVWAHLQRDETKRLTRYNRPIYSCHETLTIPTQLPLSSSAKC